MILITVKMFRTWAANNMLLRELLKMEMPKTQRQTRKNIQNAAKNLLIDASYLELVKKVI